jgi:crotonobetainyl-CoA:carnitine CoA-transferase CaiB-like acyl-CoA transferase
LAEYGADVIKVNNAAIGTGKGDPDSDDPLAFLGHRTTNAGKRLMYLDLKREKGAEIARSLVDTADVVHVNFAIETAQRLGLGEEDIRVARPSVIYSTLNLHSRGGWREGHRGHEDLAQAVTGLSLRFGGGVPEMHAVLVNDYGTGHLAAFGIMLALFTRLKSGVGQTVETSLSRTATLHQMPYMIGFEGQSWSEPWGPDALGWSPLDRWYQTSAGWIYVAAAGAEDVERLSTVAALAGVERLPAEQLEAELSRRFATASASIWEDRLRAAGVPAQIYRSSSEVMEDDLAIGRGLSVIRNHPGLGEARGIGVIRRFSSSLTRQINPTPAPGYHTVSILEELGYGAEVEGLLRDEVAAGPSPEAKRLDRTGSRLPSRAVSGR